MADLEATRHADQLAKAALDGKAEDLVLLDLRQLTLLADYFLICTGTSDRHVRALGQRVETAADDCGAQMHHREGVDEGRWVLLDFGDVVVHIFDPQTREYYRLEELWADAPRVDVTLAA